MSTLSWLSNTARDVVLRVQVLSMVVAMGSVGLRSAAADVREDAGTLMPEIVPHYPVVQDGKYGYIDSSGNLVIECKYDAVAPVVFRGELREVRVGDMWGFINDSGEMVIEPQYRRVVRFREGRAPVQMPCGAWTWIDPDGTQIAEPRFQQCWEFTSGLAPFSVDGRTWGFADRAGQVVIPPRFQGYYWFCGDVAVASEDGQRWGLIDKSGTFVVPPRFRILYPPQEGLAVASPTSAAADGEGSLKFGMIDGNGEWVVPPVYDRLGHWFEDLLAVNVGGSSRILPSGAGIPFPPLVQQTGGRWGFLNREGQMQITPRFDDVGRFQDGQAWAGVAVTSEGDSDETEIRYGIIDRSGEWVLPPTYGSLPNFHGDLAPVRHNGRWGYIDRRGQMVIPAQFDRAGAFRDGLAEVQMGDRSGYINREGEWVWEHVK